MIENLLIGSVILSALLFIAAVIMIKEYLKLIKEVDEMDSIPNDGIDYEYLYEFKRIRSIERRTCK